MKDRVPFLPRAPLVYLYLSVWGFCVCCASVNSQTTQTNLTLEKCTAKYNNSLAGTLEKLENGMALAESLSAEDILKSIELCESNLQLAESLSIPNACAVIHLQKAINLSKRFELELARKQFKLAQEKFDELAADAYHLRYYKLKFEYEQIDIAVGHSDLNESLAKLLAEIERSDNSWEKIWAKCQLLSSQVYSTGEKFGLESAVQLRSDIKKLRESAGPNHGKLSCLIMDCTQLLARNDLVGFERELPVVERLLGGNGSRAAWVLHSTNVGMYSMLKGDINESRQGLKETLQSAKDLGSRDLQFANMVCLGEVELAAKQYAEAEHWARAIEDGFEGKRPFQINLLDTYYRWRYRLAKATQSMDVAVEFADLLVSEKHLAKLALQDARYRSLNLRLFQLENEKRKDEIAFRQQEAGYIESLSIAKQEASQLKYLLTFIGLLIGSVSVAGILISTLRRLRLTRIQLQDEQVRGRRERHLRDTAEQRLVRMERMESLGLLAGGIAHDFNNLLVGVIGNAEILKLDGRADSEFVSKCADNILIAAEKAADLSRQMLAYSGQGVANPERIEINQRITEMQPLFSPTVSDEVDVVVEVCDLPLHANVDGTEFDQIVMNLVSNARRACESSGQIKIQTGVERINDSDIFVDQKLYGVRSSGGEFCFIEVADNGIGIDPECVKHVFDPFYTRSESGRGLGLAVVYGLVASCEGLIRLKTQPGAGTQFRILLPLATQAQGCDETSNSNSAIPASQSSFLEKRILVVDDEESVRDWIATLCRTQGISVTCLSDGTEVAECIVQANKDQPYDFLVVDMMMPGGTAEEVLQGLEREGLQIPTVIISGHGHGQLNRLFKYSNVVSILEKPFKGSRLIEVLKQRFVQSDH